MRYQRLFDKLMYRKKVAQTVYDRPISLYDRRNCGYVRNHYSTRASRNLLVLAE